MWDLAVREADYAAADAYLQRYRGAPPWSRRVVPPLARGDSAAVASLLEEARASENRQVQIAARYVATFLEDYSTAERLARLELEWRRRPAIRADAQLFLGWLEMARGRWSAAQGEFAAAEQVEGAPDVLIHRALAAALPFGGVPRQDLQAIRGEVSRWKPQPEAGEAPALAVRLRPHLRLYLLGMLSVRLGDRDAALAFANQLGRLEAPPDAASVVRALALTVRADVAWQRGRAAEALSLLEPVRGEVPLELVRVPAYTNVREYAQEQARYLRAELLARLGRDREALRWLQTAFHGAPDEFVYHAPVHQRLAEIYERLGDREQAARHYGRFIELWKECDAPLRPAVEAAQARLKQLTGGSP